MPEDDIKINVNLLIQVKVLLIILCKMWVAEVNIINPASKNMRELQTST